MLYTTLKLLHESGACRERYAHFLRAVGKDTYDSDEPIPLTRVLEANNLTDALWCLRATTTRAETARFARLLACDFAERVLPIFERAHPSDNGLRAAIETARRFARGEATGEELNAARIAARVAGDAGNAAWAAGEAAWAAAWAAVSRNAAWAAACAAASAAGYAAGAAEKKWQQQRFTEMLGSATRRSTFE